MVIRNYMKAVFFVVFNYSAIAMENENTTVLRSLPIKISPELATLINNIENRDYHETARLLKKNPELALKYKSQLIKHANEAIAKTHYSFCDRDFKKTSLKIFNGSAKTVFGILCSSYGIFSESRAIFVPVGAYLTFDGIQQLANVFIKDNESEKNAFAIKTLVTDLKAN